MQMFTLSETTAVTTQQIVGGSLSGAFTLPGREGRREREGEEGGSGRERGRGGREWKRGGREGVEERREGGTGEEGTDNVLSSGVHELATH